MRSRDFPSPTVSSEQKIRSRDQVFKYVPKMSRNKIHRHTAATINGFLSNRVATANRKIVLDLLALENSPYIRNRAIRSISFLSIRLWNIIGKRGICHEIQWKSGGAGMCRRAFVHLLW